MDREMKGGTEGRIAFMERGIPYFLEGRNQVALICAAQGRCEHAEMSKEARFPWKNCYDGRGNSLCRPHPGLCARGTSSRRLFHRRESRTPSDCVEET